MSHASGEVWTPEGTLLGYFEYNGTVDVACARIFESFDTLWDNWRGDVCRDCTCGGTVKQDVVLFTNYGGGFYWPGKACLPCCAITDGHHPFDPFDDDNLPIDGHPFPHLPSLFTNR